MCYRQHSPHANKDLNGQLYRPFGPSGIRHSVEVTAESLYEAAALGLRLLGKAEWTDPIATGAQLEVLVREPATIHAMLIRHLYAWLERLETPAEMSRKAKLKNLLVR